MLESLRARFSSFSMRAAAIGLTAVIVIAAVAVGGYLSTKRGPFDFTQHQKVSAASVLRLHFPQEMHQDSVEKLMTVPEGLTVEKSWKDGVLELKPTEKLMPGKTYVITIDARALTSEGQPIGRDIEFTFDVTGAPVVSAQIPPTGAKSVQSNARIVIVFDRPVVALSQVQDAMGANKLPSWPVTISPAIAGRWRWIGTTSVQFVPTSPLKLDTAYTVNVPAGIQTVSGDITEKDFSWTFETERPFLVSAVPQEGSSDSGPSTTMTLHFNQAMDLAAAKGYLALQENGTTSVGIGTVTYGTTMVDDTKVTDKTVLVIKPATPFKFQSKYVLEIKAGIRGLEGPLGSETSAFLPFDTVGPMAVTSANYDHGRLDIRFSNPVESSSLPLSISFTPKVPALTEEDLRSVEWNGSRSFDIYGKFDPSTKYTLTVSTKLKDSYGQHPAKSFTYTWTTPKLSPRIFIHPENNRFSIFERGKSPVYYVNDLNVSGVDVTMAEIPVDVFLKSQPSQNYYNGNYFLDPAVQGVNVKSWHIKPGAKLNLWESVAVDTAEKFGAPLKPALYVFDIAAPELDAQNRPLHDQRVFAVTNMGITLKYSGDKVLVWVTDLQTGGPISGAAVELRALNGSTPLSGATNKDGFFESKITLSDFVTGQNRWQPQFWVIVRKDDDLAFAASDWNRGVQPYDFDGIQQDFHSPESAKFRVLSTLFTERPVYKAGDVVFMKGIIRNLDWSGNMIIPVGQNIQVKVTDSSGKEIYAKDLKVSDFGSFSDSLPIDPKAPLGYYSISASPASDDRSYGGIYGSFQVLAYRKPEYKVTVTPETQDYYSGQTVKAEISGQYYFGAPMDEANVSWRAVSRDYYFNRFTDGWYSFGLSGSWCWYDCERSLEVITEGKGRLDASGRLMIEFPVNLDQKSVSQVVSIEADITDKNNQIVSSREDLIVHKAKVYIGIRSDDYVVTPGQKTKLSIVTVNPDGTPARDHNVTLSLYSRVWNTVREKGVDGEYYYDNQPKDTFIRSIQAATTDSGKGTAEMPIDDGGQFVIVASIKDADGREAKSSTYIYAWSSTYFNWPRSNNDRMEIVADKPTYKVGDTAKLLVKSPYQGKGVKALVTVERENVISHKVVDVTSNALPIEIPITDDLLPTAYVSVVVVKPRIGETFNENGLDTGAPAFKVGYVKLPIDTAPRRLTVNIRTDKEKYLPGDTVNVTLETIDPKGNPVQAELSLGVVDLSLLDLTGFTMPDLVEQFWSQRGLGVMTSNMLTFMMERFKPGSKGGGGGDGESRARGEFKDTAFWKPRILTDINGLATLSFKLPDNLTTWQFLALGSTKSNLFGGQFKNVIETKHVILRPVRPRFAVIGDKVKVGAIVHNYLDETRTFTVGLVGKGMNVEGSPKSVTIPKDGNAKVMFDTTISDASDVTMHFLAQTDGARDEITETIPTFRFGVEQSNATAGMTDDQVEEIVAIPTKKDAPTGTLEIKMAPSIAVYLASGLDYLLKYPYGCAEQTVSQFLPNVVLKQLQGFEVFRIVDDAALERNIRSGLGKLYTFQRSDGGFGYWEDSERSYPRLTAYIFYALTITRKSGFSVDGGVMDRARNYLDDAIRNPETYGELADPSTRAYVLYVLSEDGTTDIALLNNLMKLREALPIYARAYLAMAYQNAGTNAAKRSASDLLQDILGHAQVDARRAEFQEDSGFNAGYSMNTNDRTTAIALQALLRIDPGNAITMKLVRGMLSARENGHWDTTQSTVTSLRSFIEYIKQTDEMNFDFSAVTAIDDKNVLEHNFKKPKLEQIAKILSINDLPRGKTVSAKVGKEGPGKLYYDMILSYFYTPDVIEPAEEGIGILREMVPVTGGAKGVSVGNNYKVTLTITVPEQRHFVAVESPLPAGMEAIDLHLSTSQQNLYQDEVNTPDQGRNWWNSSLWYFNHIEFRDDQVFLFADNLPPGVYTYEYLARATTPGTFHVRPAKVSEMYFPETFGQTKGEWLTINE